MKQDKYKRAVEKIAKNLRQKYGALSFAESELMAKKMLKKEGRYGY